MRASNACRQTEPAPCSPTPGKMQKSFIELFPERPAVIAMIHTGPSPGVPGFLCVESALERAIAETEIYLQIGVDGILIENMRDFPCIHERNQGPEVGAFMTRIARAIKRRAGRIPVGIQILFQANRTALAVALASGCDFIRAEGWTFAHISDKGIAEASAGETIRYRQQIGATDIPVYADIKKKHASHAWTADVGLAEMARSMELHHADGVIVTGHHTGIAPSAEDLRAVREATRLPVFIGSGVSVDTLPEIGSLADAYIVGSAIKEGGVWEAPVSEDRCQQLCDAIHSSGLREQEA